jgi:hypothetical protein
VGNLAGVLAGVVALCVVIHSGAERSKTPQPLPVRAPAAPAPVAAAPRAAEPEKPNAPAPISLNRAAIARAETALDAATRDRARAEARAEEAAGRLAEASRQAAADAAAGRTLAMRVRDPSAQIARASSRGGFLRAERDRIKGELIALSQAPRPKAKTLVDRTPVARPAGGDEFHFELRRNRVAFIDLDRLISLVKADAQLRIRVADNARVVGSKVGPVGAFSLQYVLGRTMPDGIAELMERRGMSYDFRGWEVIPEFEGRGETYEATLRPVSDYARAINRLSPASATITMWVYPDGFALYRKLRDDLHARGFLVAARPLPEGMAIKGSPAGSLSAGQ